MPSETAERDFSDEKYCTEFTTDHGLDEPEEGVFTFAFVCPRCEQKNPLQGDPKGFSNKPFACTRCRWVPLLVREKVLEFREEAYDG